MHTLLVVVQFSVGFTVRNTNCPHTMSCLWSHGQQQQMQTQSVTPEGIWMCLKLLHLWSEHVTVTCLKRKMEITILLIGISVLPNMRAFHRYITQTFFLIIMEIDIFQDTCMAFIYLETKYIVNEMYFQFHANSCPRTHLPAKAINI